MSAIPLERHQYPVTHLSYSSISTYITCGRQWKYKYIELLPGRQSPEANFGTAFHSTVEDIIRERSTKKKLTPVEVLWERYAERLLSHLFPEDQRSGYTELLDLGRSMIMAEEVQEVVFSLEPMITTHNRQPVIERTVELHIPGVDVPVTGRLDLLDKDGIPYDFKTSASSWAKDRAQGELQPLFYLAALAEAGKTSPFNTFTHIVFPKEGKNRVQVFTHQRENHEIEWMFQAAREYWEAIKAGVFTPNPGSYLCSKKWCSYWDICRGKK